MLQLLKRFWIHIALVAVVLLLVLAGIHSVALQSGIEEINVAKNSIKRAVVQCYAIEGAYPTDIFYLEKNYGLQINRDKYFIYYEAYAENMFPDVVVILK
jgi:hypothetical protein